VREEAGELCQTLEGQEGQERAASEMADLLYHAMVLLNVQVRGVCLLATTGRCRELSWHQSWERCG
jgi:phosphoribosyl-ATP pyrophosphohydrolase